jgi:putative transposase
MASTYLAGTNTRRVKRALVALFKGAVGKDVVSRVWRKVKSDWEAWTRRRDHDFDHHFHDRFHGGFQEGFHGGSSFHR